MEKYTLDFSFSKGNLEEICRKYHFEEEQKMKLFSIYQAMLPLVQVEANVILEEKKALCGVTLGSGVDSLQELYGTHKAVMEEYMVECLAMEFLGKAYCQLAEHVWEENKLWLDDFSFFGDSLPLEDMAEAVSQLDMNITCNELLALTPSKSVVFCATCKKQRGNGHGNICRFCNNVACPIRAGVALLG